MWLSLSIPIGLSVAHYFGLHTYKGIKAFKNELRSFASGFTIGYVFLFLLPEIPKMANEIGAGLLVLPLLGFMLFHLAHKAIFRNKRWYKKSTVFEEELHLTTAALYSFLVTFSLVKLSINDMARSLFLAIVIIIHIGLTELSHKEVSSGHYLERLKIPVMVMFTMLGGLLPMIGVVTRRTTGWMFAFTIGTIIYTAIREELPKDAEGNSWMFMFGVVSLIAAENILL